MKLKIVLISVIAFILIGFVGAYFFQPVPEIDGVAKAENAIIISVDGLRPDALARATTPYLDELMKQGAYTPEARTVVPSLTLSSHTSMLTGIPPSRHNVDWNEYDPLRGKIDSPSIFDLAKRNGLSTLMYVGKQKLEHLSRDGIVDQFILDKSEATEFGQGASQALKKNRPRVMMIHFRHPDTAGHSLGWMSPQQLTAIEEVDRAIAQIVLTLVDMKRNENTLVIVSADHGGHDLTHGTDSDDDTLIPWLAVGPGIPAGSQPTRHLKTFDTAAVVADFLGLIPPPGWKWVGRPTSFEIED